MQTTELLCVGMFGLVHGAEIEDLVERTTGEPCPCRQGRTCPLLSTLEAAPDPVL